MTTVVKWAALAAVLCGSPVMVSAQEFDFRKTSWGMTIAEVLASEGGEPIDSSEEGLMYSVEVADLDAMVVYSFLDNHLVRIEDFEKVKGILSRKYGDPDEDVSRWSKDLYRDDEDRYGFAISRGHLTMVALWLREDTTISLMLTGDNNELSHAVLYQSTAHAELMERKQQEEEESAF